MMRAKDRHGDIDFVDFTQDDFDFAAHQRPREVFMKRIQGQLRSGEWIEGVEVFRQAYSLLGFAWLIPLTRAPGIKQALDWLYDRFANQRLRLTGRCEEEGCGLHGGANDQPRQH